MSRIRQIEEQKKGRQIPLGGTSNEKSSVMINKKGNSSHAPTKGKKKS